jgi:hypothetical protein
MACLEPPFYSDDLKELSSKILADTPKPLNQGVYSERLSQFILGVLLQKDPNHRPYML